MLDVYCLVVMQLGRLDVLGGLLGEHVETKVAPLGLEQMLNGEAHAEGRPGRSS